MGIASIWTGLGLRTSGPDHRAPCICLGSGGGGGGWEGGEAGGVWELGGQGIGLYGPGKRARGGRGFRGS